MSYSIKKTVFEINKTSSAAKGAEIMRKKRQVHDKIVETRGILDKKDLLLVPLPDSETSSKKGRKSSQKRKHDDDDEDVQVEVSMPSAKKSIRDEENYIQYKPKNFNTEKA